MTRRLVTANWTASPGRRAGKVCQVRDARDEEEAFFTLKGIKQRARRESAETREERAKAAERAKITLPKLKFMED